MKKTLAFFTCSNGLGHFSRILKISEYLQNEFDITIYCEKFQYDKFNPKLNVNFEYYILSNIRWDKTLTDNKVDFETYFKWCSIYGPKSLKYDIAISDNVVGLLRYRKDIILSGSFLWKDIYQNKFEDNKLSSFDNELIEKFKPVILTNKYAEVSSLKTYSNKQQFGWGCDIEPAGYWGKGSNIVLGIPSLNYLPEYKKFMLNFAMFLEKNNVNFNWNVKKNTGTTFVIRPGVGMLTHCVENYIPIIALYSEKDSVEIIELANKVEELGIGKKVNIDSKNISFENLITYDNNDIYKKVILEKEGYKKIANYLKEL